MKRLNNMNLLKQLFYSLLLLAAALPLKAQTVDNLDKAIEMLKKVSLEGDAGPLSFDLRYTYANEGKPGVIIDSLNGNIRTAGGNVFTKMRNTIFLVNKSYNIAVFEEDKLIHVSKPVNKDSLGVTPLQMIKQSIQQAGIQRCLITSRKDTTQIRFIFASETMYKYMEIKLDTRLWRIHQMQFVVKSEMASDAEIAPGTLQEPYALVNAYFTGYSTGVIDPAVFDEKQFFTRTPEALVPVTAYQDYEVFIGSPNL